MLPVVTGPCPTTHRKVISPCGSTKLDRLTCVAEAGLLGLMGGASIFIFLYVNTTTQWSEIIAITAMAITMVYLGAIRSVVLDTQTNNIRVCWRLLDLVEIAHRAETLEKYYGVRVRYEHSMRSHWFLVELVGMYGTNVTLQNTGQDVERAFAIRDEVVAWAGLTVVEDPFHARLYSQLRK